MQNSFLLIDMLETMIQKVILFAPSYIFSNSNSKNADGDQNMIPLSLFSFEIPDNLDEKSAIIQMTSNVLYSGGNLKVYRLGTSWFLEDLLGNQHLCPTEKFLLDKESHQISVDDYRRLLFVYLGHSLDSEWIPQILH